MNLKTMNYDELILHAEDVMKAVRERSYAEGYGQGRFDERVEKLYEKATPAYASPQHYRDEIIEKAKRDVAQIEYDQSENLLRMKYVVNREKRTIVCLSERYDHGYIDSKGIAKCDPSDCFNVHIGKAIALRRALGLEVPAEYLNAPQPTEYRAGDIIELPSGEADKCRLDHPKIPDNERCLDDSRE